MAGTTRERRSRVTTVVRASVAEHVRLLALEQGAALSRLIEQALIEYVDARPLHSDADLLAKTARRPGRPSILDVEARNAKIDALRKRTGRPLGATPPRDPRG